ncbi:immunoglobulin domain-containing protein [Ditylenchus destructor]|nr:immunoglobulin domain-containing protein [Ditylenchus destructor]
MKPDENNLDIPEGDSLNLTCRAIGNFVPVIKWRVNGTALNCVAPDCQQVSVNGTGTLTLKSLKRENEGAYTCEAFIDYRNGLPNKNWIVRVADRMTKASSMDFSQERMPPRIWFVENGSDFIRVELPKPFIMSAETMNNVYGGDGWIEDTPEIGNTNSGRVIKIVGTEEEIQYQLQLISEDIKMNVDNSRTPLTDEQLEFVIEVLIDDEKQKNPGKQINENEIRARVRKDEEERKQFLNENWRGEVYTSEIYD